MSSYLMHHGIKGQKWGVRQYQNPDGSLTEAGKMRYGSGKNIEKRTEDVLNRSYSTEYLTKKVEKSYNKEKQVKKIRTSSEVSMVVSILAALGTSSVGILFGPLGIGAASIALGSSFVISQEKNNRKMYVSELERREGLIKNEE